MVTLRYYIAVMLIVAVPAVILYWLLIHPFVRFWRRQRKCVTYTAVCFAIVVMMIAMFQLRGFLLSSEWGTNGVLVAIGLACLAISGWLHKLVATQLPLRVLIGIPELNCDENKGHLITSGIYARVRHPRYLQMDLALMGYALIANYPAGYAAFIVWLAGIRIVALFEERELTERFGDEYLDYCRRVPRFVPRFVARSCRHT
jgi:protein-S-isoprenylcysteine O-methyltransferase Ste14